jgi:putative acetyltransferase
MDRQTTIPRVNLRLARSTDEAAIRDLIYAAFQNHPHHAPGVLPSEHLLVDRLRADGMLTLSLVAESSDRVVGHLAVSPVRISSGVAGWFGLGPVAVAPRHQRRGIGSALIHHGLLLLREQAAAGIVVFGDPKLYRRFGFRNQPALVLPGFPASYFMALPLAAAVAAGTVNYHPAFG